MEKILGILRFALAREIEGREFYKEKATRAKSKEVRDTLESLWKMEEEHVEFIKSLMEKVQSDIEIDVDSVLTRSDFFEEREKEELSVGTLDDIANDMSILRMAYLIEEDFENFYRTTAEKVEDSDMKRILNTLAKWELGHKNMLFELYNDVKNAYWNKQGFTPLF
ncbi:MULTISPECIES: ferritin-like domain-containing protein [Fervidobacterium]|uniref:Rubrerythrin n=1 Tax=Fervidobacterium nodosum (strain ATCC 35602 / DSM 5306 / Rt17-B1) TaxID=381764 RepID=A7HLF7_FERNB|nr:MULTISPECIES: ferritin family protein [Fervidobacterium]ABS60740.1 Rubrerythrin [Fervidobacterium nodosum Rt17-B1]KAF2960898.1 rubrerythrin [Fervidobacterium sp. 2310opik-2]PHJ14198.1 rubrerythrin [Fervidobacterium sp. SC_NGM5_G05]HOJ93745.1 ferritin family protein [Fervidobacterium nodosum]